MHNAIGFYSLPRWRSFTGPSSVYTIPSLEAAIPLPFQIWFTPNHSHTSSSCLFFGVLRAFLSHGSSFHLLTPTTFLCHFHDNTCSFMQQILYWVPTTMLLNTSKVIDSYMAISPTGLWALTEQELYLIYSVTPDSNLEIGIWERQVYWMKEGREGGRDGWINGWMDD